MAKGGIMYLVLLAYIFEGLVSEWQGQIGTLSRLYLP